MLRFKGIFYLLYLLFKAFLENNNLNSGRIKIMFLKDYTYQENGEEKIVTKGSEVAKVNFEIRDNGEESSIFDLDSNVTVDIRIPTDSNNLRKVPMVINDLREYLGYQELF